MTGWFVYSPSIPGNAVLAAGFLLLVPPVALHALRYATAFFSTLLLVGLALDAAGFVSRVLLHDRPADNDDSGGGTEDQRLFLLAQLGTVLGPTFAAAAALVVLPHLLAVYGWRAAPVRPLLAAAVSYALVVATVVLQVVGVVFAAGEFANVSRDRGPLVVAAGLGVQVLALGWFFTLYVWLSISVARSPGGPDRLHRHVYSAPVFGRFVLGLGAAAGLLLVYTIYRLIEMLLGLSGFLFRDQTAFMIMDGVLPLLAAALLIIFSPGRAFTLPVWAATSPRYGRSSSSSSSFHSWCFSSSSFPASPSSPRRPTRSILSRSAHIRYDPNIRSRHGRAASPDHGGVFPPYDSQAQSTPRYDRTPHDIQSRLGSPGLPSHPGMMRDLAARRASTGDPGCDVWPLSALPGSSSAKDDDTERGSMDFATSSGGGHGQGEERLSDGRVKSRLVDSEAIW